MYSSIIYTDVTIYNRARVVSVQKLAALYTHCVHYYSGTIYLFPPSAAAVSVLL